MRRKRASALRAILRQDPDVILVGEIRDKETAEVAVQAAMTGHLVLATLHTNDAVSVIARLLDIGLDHASIAATLRGALAQRLVRKVCDECGEPIRGVMTDEEVRLARLYNIRPPMRSVGCRRCAETGYRGRMPVQEVFVLNNTIADMLTSGATYTELYSAAVASGMRSLQQVGIERVRSGETTLEEMERVLGLDADDSGEAEAAARAAEAAEDVEADRTADAADSAAPDGFEAGSGAPPRDRLETPERAVPSPSTEAPEPPRAAEAPERSPGAERAGALENAEAALREESSVEVEKPAENGMADALDLDRDDFVARAPNVTVGMGGSDGDLPILVVDDDPEDRLLVRTILQKQELDVKEARDGDQALERIGAGDAHAMVILDLEMPTMGGREVLAALRASPDTTALPVIVLTGSPDPEDECRLMEEGADDYLRKPLDAPRFVARVRAALRRARMT